jgi:hypothetical protein
MTTPSIYANKQDEVEERGHVSPSLKSASMTRRPKQPESILSFVHFGIGSLRLSRGQIPMTTGSATRLPTPC